MRDMEVKHSKNVGL